MTTEQRAEELESRVGSVEHMNLLLQQSTSSHQGGQHSGGQHHNSFSTGGGGGGGNSDHQRGGNTPLGVPPQPPPRSGRPSAAVPPFDHGSPPHSGRSTPKAHPLMPQGGGDPYMHKYHTVSRINVDYRQFNYLY